MPASRFAGPAARAFLAGRDLELLQPLSFGVPGQPWEVRPRDVDRRRLAKEMERANNSYGHPCASKLAAKLADPSTVVVVAGQQAGLFGGPLFSLTKMVGVAKWAHALEQRGVPAVGVFWVATEDHDYREIARCVLGAVAEVLEAGDDEQPLMPVGMRTWGTGVEDVLHRARELYPGGESEPALAALSSAFRPDARIGEAFSRFMVWLLGERAPLLLDSMLPALKDAEKPWLRELLERRVEVAEAVEAASRRVGEAGHKLQVRCSPEASPLFLLHGVRRCRIVWNGDDRYSLRGTEQSEGEERPVKELLEAIDENPSVVSPGVLARPVIQDAVLGSGLQLMGPGELAYMMQAAALYPVLGVDAPVTSLRPQILVLEAKQRGRLRQLEMTLEETLATEVDLEEKLARRAGIEFLEDARESLMAGVDDLGADALAIDIQLERPWHKTRGQVEHALDLFSQKVVAAASRQDVTARRRVEEVRSRCLPLGTPQERTLSTAHFALTYGRDFVSSVWNQMALDSDRIQIVDPHNAGSLR